MKRWIAFGLALMLLAGMPGTPLMLQQSAYAQVGYEPLEYGATGETVAQIQERLAALGYYKGKVSGNFLDGTRAAVKRFQKDYGLEETGIVDGQTEALLMTAEYRVLGYGTEGDEVKRLQEHLDTLGYFSDKHTGKYMEATAGAVKSFQEKNGLGATGEADVETQRLLFSNDALSKDAPEATHTPDPDADLGDINDVVMVEDGNNNDAATEDNEYSKKLRRGAKGEEVKEVQNRLTELGFFDGPISGNYMNQTVTAVKAFQTMNGLKSDGVTGEDTWNLLFNSQEVLNASATPRPTPVPTPVPYAVTVDVKNQVTLVYGRDENGEYNVPVKRMICSTGMKATPSDVGDWVSNGRRARWAYFPAWGSHAQYWTRINSNIAFHSVIYRKVDTMALSVKSYNLLGSRASHGCIRLLVTDAKWIYDNIGEGTTISVREDLLADPELRNAVKAPPLNKKNMWPASTPEPTPEPEYKSGTVPPQPWRDLKERSEGEDVYWLQARLKELGYYPGTVTGLFLSGTKNAVKKFQKDNGIYASGKADEKTLTALYAGVLASPAPSESPSPDEPPVPTLTLTPQSSPSPTPPPKED